jgi:membrane protein DedA with SNARE-associated domain
MTELVVTVIETLGYVGIFFLMLIEVVFPPIPSEIILPFAGFAAARGSLSLFWVIAIATLGATTGATVIYWIGKLLHQEKIERFVLRFGKILGIKKKDIDKSQDWFDRHGYRAVLLGRMVPIVRTFISLPAGMRRMSFVPFLAYSFIGSLGWSTLLVLGGYVLGEEYQRVEGYLKPVTLVLVGLIGVGALYWVGRNMYRSKKETSLE